MRLSTFMTVSAMEMCIRDSFGTLAGGLGSFPFDCPTYLVQSDSRSSSTWHSEFEMCIRDSI